MRPAFLTVLSVLAATPVAAQSDREFVRNDVLGAMSWRTLGPTTFGGRIVDIEVDPTNRARVYVAAGSGGLFKTDNAGTTFRPIFDDQAVVSIGDIAIAPSDPNVLYVGTGEANNQRSSYWGDGVYKSTDAGKTWTHVGLRGTDHIGRIVVHPTNPDRVYVAALGALYSPNEERGLYRTVDGGASWQCVQHIDEDTGFVDVIIDPENPDTLLAASYERRRRAWDFDESGPGSGVWRSTDGGNEWTRIEKGLPGGEIGRIGLALCATDPSVVYTIIENRNPRPPKKKDDKKAVDASASKDEAGKKEDGEKAGKGKGKAPQASPGAYEPFDPDYDEYADREEEDEAPGARRKLVGGEVYRSDDGGETWKKQSTKPVAGSPHYYYGQVRVDPNNANRLVTLGVNAWHSNDAGKTWKSDFQSRLHVDCHALWIDPRDSKHSWIGNDGGLAETWDGGKTWRYVNQLPLAQFYEIGVDDRVPYTIYGGTQDNGSWAIPSRSTDSFAVGHDDTIKVGGGDGFYVRVDPENQDIVYSESQFGGLGRMNLVTGARARLKPRAPKGSPKLRFNWNSPLVVSAHSAPTIYFGSQYVHRSRNRGDDWEIISADLTTNDADKLAGDVPHCTITQIAESPHDADTLLVGTDDGNVWMTRTGGKRWIDLTDRFEGVPPRLWVSRVEFSASDSKTAYVSFTGYREDIREPYLFLTTDGGDSFRSISNDLPKAPVNVVREHPRNPNVLFVGHEFGVACSVDGGASWYPLGNGLPTTPVHDLLVHPREDDLVVGTHGRGIFVLDITPLAELDESILAKSFHAFRPRDGFRRGRAYQRVRYPGAAPWRADRVSSAAKFSYYLSEDSDDAVEITVYDAAERELFTSRGESTAGLHTVEWRSASRGGGRRRAANPAAGDYLVVVEHGRAFAEYRFRVLPGPGEILGDPSANDEDEQLDEETEGDEEASDIGY